jgi:Ca-activated chloride channel family protein
MSSSDRILKSSLNPFFPFLFLLAFLVLPAQAQGEAETIFIDSPLVVVNATVTNSGVPLSNLRKEAFTVLENGVVQNITSFETSIAPFAAVILLDSSGSMGTRIDLARSAAIAFLDGIREDDFVAIYTFDTTVRKIKAFSNDTNVPDRLFDVRAEGMTVLNDGIIEATRALSARPENRRAIIVLSDGADTYSSASTERAIRFASNANVAIYTVDIAGGGADSSQPTTDQMRSRAALKTFAEKTGGLFFSNPGGARLRESFKSVVAEIGGQYTLAYQPEGRSERGRWMKLEVKVARPNVSVRSRTGYFSR